MKLAILFGLVLAPMLALTDDLQGPEDGFSCIVKDLVVDASDLNAISGTYHIKCNGVWGALSHNLQLRKNGNFIHESFQQREFREVGNGAKNLYDAYLFRPGLLGDKDGLEVCVSYRASNTTGYTAKDDIHCDGP